MNLPTDRPTAQILDFEAFRQRRRAQVRAASRRFVWSWPASGHTMLVQFPTQPVMPAPIRSQQI